MKQWKKGYDFEKNEEGYMGGFRARKEKGKMYLNYKLKIKKRKVKHF